MKPDTAHHPAEQSPAVPAPYLPAVCWTDPASFAADGVWMAPVQRPFDLTVSATFATGESRSTPAPTELLFGVTCGDVSVVDWRQLGPMGTTVEVWVERPQEKSGPCADVVVWLQGAGLMAGQVLAGGIRRDTVVHFVLVRP